MKALLPPGVPAWTPGGRAGAWAARCVASHSSAEIDVQSHTFDESIGHPKFSHADTAACIHKAKLTLNSPVDQYTHGSDAALTHPR
jgi:hypothetical protein